MVVVAIERLVVVVPKDVVVTEPGLPQLIANKQIANALLIIGQNSASYGFKNINQLPKNIRRPIAGTIPEASNCFPSTLAVKPHDRQARG